MTWLDVVHPKPLCRYVADGRRERVWMRGIVEQTEVFALQEDARLILLFTFH